MYTERAFHKGLLEIISYLHKYLICFFINILQVINVYKTQRKQNKKNKISLNDNITVVHIINQSN